MDYATAAHKYGTVIYNGKTLALMQQAYISGINDDEHYAASAEDEDGNEYTVRWEIACEDVDSLQDESDACDWNKYAVKAL